MARRLLAPDMFQLGRADAVEVGRRLQPDGLLQRLGRAARQRHHRRRAEALRVRQGDQPQPRPCSKIAVTVGDYAPAELFCSFADAREPPGGLPGRLLAPGVGAGAPFLLLQAMLGISASAPANTINVNKPHLPGWLNTVELHDLRVGDSTVSIVFRRQGKC